MDIQPGDICRVIVDYIDGDEDPFYGNYLYAELEAGAVEGLLRVGRAVKGVYTHLDQMPCPYTSGDFLTVCRSFSGIYADLGSSVVAQACVYRDEVERRYLAGVESVSPRSVRFDKFSFEEHHHTNPDCLSCFCDCENICVSKTLTATIEATGDLSCLDGSTITLDWDNAQLGNWIWHGKETLPHWQCPEGYDPTEWDVWLQCHSPIGGMGPEDWVLGIRSGGPVVHDPFGSGWNPASWTCDPFIMTFPWQEESWSCTPPCQGYFRIIVAG